MVPGRCSAVIHKRTLIPLFLLSIPSTLFLFLRSMQNFHGMALFLKKKLELASNNESLAEVKQEV